MVCVQCTHTHGKTCLIQNCTSNCPTKQALEKKKDLVAGKARAFPSSCPTKQALEKKKDLGPGKAKATPMSPVASKADRTFKRARSFIERLNKKKLVERLQVLKTAGRLGNGGVPQPWFKYRGSKKILISRLHSGFAAFKAELSVTLPVGFKDALAENFDSGNTITRLGLEGKARQGAKDWKDWKATDWRDWKDQRIAMQRKRIVFKYKSEIYQNVRNFCDTFPGLRYSPARAHVVNTDFPKSACLVVPGHSSKNLRLTPENWKSAAQDLSDLDGAAYILGQRTKPTGSHLLLVCQKDLRREAESALLSAKQKKLKTNSTCKQPGIAKSHIARKRPAKVLERQQSSTSVARANC